MQNSIAQKFIDWQIYEDLENEIVKRNFHPIVSEANNENFREMNNEEFYNEIGRLICLAYSSNSFTK